MTKREVASLAMRSAKTVTQDLITDVATKSNGDDLADIDVIILVNSLTVTVGMASKVPQQTVHLLETDWTG